MTGGYHNDSGIITDEAARSMAIGNDEVRHIAKLANLEFSEDELGRFTQQFNAIVEYVARLNALDTDDIEPTSHVGAGSHCAARGRAPPFDAARRGAGQRPGVGARPLQGPQGDRLSELVGRSIGEIRSLVATGQASAVEILRRPPATGPRGRAAGEGVSRPPGRGRPAPGRGGRWRPACGPPARPPGRCSDRRQGRPVHARRSDHVRLAHPGEFRAGL